jgi:hypothetical protein
MGESHKRLIESVNDEPSVDKLPAKNTEMNLDLGGTLNKFRNLAPQKTSFLSLQ